MVTRLSGGITPADGEDPRTFPSIWNATADTIESQGTAISGAESDIDTLQSDVTAAESDIDDLEAKNIPAFGTAAPSEEQVLAYSTASSEYAPVTLDLDYLSDVTIGTAVSDGQVLAYSTAVSGWVNDTAAAGGGKVLQVVSTTKTDTFSASVGASGTTVAVTGLSASITPSSTANKIIVLFTINGGASGPNPVFVRLFKDGSLSSFVGDAAGSRQRISNQIVLPPDSGRNPATSGVFLDSPATTSSVTYDVRVSHRSGSTRTVYINRSETDANSNATNRSASSITLMEVAR